MSSTTRSLPLLLAAVLLAAPAASQGKAKAGTKRAAGTSTPRSNTRKPAASSSFSFQPEATNCV